MRQRLLSMCSRRAVNGRELAPSLPWIGGSAPCYAASSQLARHRKYRSYGDHFGASIPVSLTYHGTAPLELMYQQSPGVLRQA
jgi:hypothetical protein